MVKKPYQMTTSQATDESLQSTIIKNFSPRDQRMMEYATYTISCSHFYFIHSKGKRLVLNYSIRLRPEINFSVCRARNNVRRSSTADQPYLRIFLLGNARVMQWMKVKLNIITSNMKLWWSCERVKWDEWNASNSIFILSFVFFSLHQNVDR